MLKKRLLLVVIVLLTLPLIFAVSACGKKAEETNQKQEGQASDTNATESSQPTNVLKVGVIQAMSGAGAAWGITINKASDVYAELINEDGGLKIGDQNYKVEMYYGDDEDGSADKAVIAARELVDNRKVSAVVGYWGGALPSLASVLMPAKVFLVGTNPVNYDPKVMPYVAFSYLDGERVSPQLNSVLKWFKDTKTIGVLIADVWYASLGPGIKQAQQELSKKGIKVVIESYPAATIDFTSIIEKMKNEGVDTIYGLVFPTHAAQIQKSLWEMGLRDKIHFSSSGALVDPKGYIDMAGGTEAVEGSLAGFEPPWDLKEAKVSPEMLDMANRIKQRHQEKYNEEMVYMSSFNYALGSMAMYFQALQKAGTTDPEAVSKSIEGGKFGLFNGTYTTSGQKTYGRQVFIPGTAGGMGVFENGKLHLVEETPLLSIP